MFPDDRPDAGVGLIELVLVLAFTSVLAALAMPNLSAARHGYELLTAGANVEAKVAEARTNAVKRNLNAWVLVTPATGTVQVQTVGVLAPVNVSPAEQLPPRVTIVAPNVEQQLLFDTLGRPIDAAGALVPHIIQIRHTETGLVRTVTVGTTGRVTIN
jgi:Tfp pilus assembly protein FimT